MTAADQPAPKPSEAKSKDMCRGCYDDLYNSQPDGCWSYDTATVMLKKFVHVDQVPPWKNKPTLTLSCHHKQRYVSVPLDAER